MYFMFSGNLAARRTSVCQMAAAAHCSVVPEDMGIAGAPVPGVQDCRIAPGTKDFTCGPAMTRAQAVQAIGLSLIHIYGGVFQLGQRHLAALLAGAANAAHHTAKGPRSLAVWQQDANRLLQVIRPPFGGGIVQRHAEIPHGR